MVFWRGGCLEYMYIKVYRMFKKIMRFKFVIKFFVLFSRWVGSWERGENKKGGEVSY